MKIVSIRSLGGVQYTHSKSTNRTLSDCYAKCSEAKEAAFDYCLQLFRDYNGRDLKITGYNTTTFSVAFYGEYNGRQAFFYITRSYDRVAYIDEVQ